MRESPERGSEVTKMWYEEKEINWSMTGGIEEDDEEGLDEPELARLQYFAEHPELADPLIWFLPKMGRRRQ